jgi:hypothetical protein
MCKPRGAGAVAAGSEVFSRIRACLGIGEQRPALPGDSTRGSIP